MTQSRATNDQQGGLTWISSGRSFATSPRGAAPGLIIWFWYWMFSNIGTF